MNKLSTTCNTLNTKPPCTLQKKKKIPFNFPIPHKPRNHYHMQIPKDDEEKKKKTHNHHTKKPNSTFRYQIKILNIYQTENKHATLIKEKLLKEINNSRTKLHKKKGKSFTYLFLGVCALCWWRLSALALALALALLCSAGPLLWKQRTERERVPNQNPNTLCFILWEGGFWFWSEWDFRYAQRQKSE